MSISNLQRYLEARQLHGAPTSAPVKQITKRGGWRTVHFEDGTKQTYSKRQLVNRFNVTLQRDQAKMAVKSVRQMKDGTATAMIGGKQRGERRKYSSPQSALRAIRRAYPKAKDFYVK
jgi:hypothetical protein